MQDIESHQRVLNTLTDPIERPVLRWLASRMPSWVTPDILTGVGVVGAIVIFLGYWLCYLDENFLWLASLGFVINWFGDSLDGTLARYRRIERPRYGFFIDHTVDAFNEVLVFLGLGLSPYVRFDLACLALIGYLLLSVIAYICTCALGEFRLSYGKLGPTEARLLGISANTVVFFLGNPMVTLFSLTLTVYDWIAIFAILLLAIIAIGAAVYQARILAKLDPWSG